MKKLRIATQGVPDDYPSSLIPIIIRHLGYDIKWSKLDQADLVIYGPFFRNLKKYRLIPKPFRPLLGEIEKQFQKRDHVPITLFQTGENSRHNMVETDFSLSFDLTNELNHYRFPYWMELVDWSHEGIIGNHNPRFGKLLSIKQMMQPLGNQFLNRNHKAVFVTSHLLEPRKTLFNNLSKLVEVDGFGPYFNADIKNHHRSGFDKLEVLGRYTFNLCPENSLYPGYYTEKIPEAFLSGCLPLAWTDSNVHVDFNPNAMINLQPMMWNQLEDLKVLIHDQKKLQVFADQPLIVNQPSIEPLKDFIKNILDNLN
jgi:hypothetical protein